MCVCVRARVCMCVCVVTMVQVFRLEDNYGVNSFLLLSGFGDQTWIAKPAW